MKIAEFARLSGLSAHTIRYYERIGLLERVGRDASGHRDYDNSALEWTHFLGRLKATGMSIREMQLYAQLRRTGKQTEAERCRLLQRHRDRVRQRLAETQACLAYLDRKIDNYTSD